MNEQDVNTASTIYFPDSTQSSCYPILCSFMYLYMCSFVPWIATLEVLTVELFTSSPQGYQCRTKHVSKYQLGNNDTKCFSTQGHQIIQHIGYQGKQRLLHVLVAVWIPWKREAEQSQLGPQSVFDLLAIVKQSELEQDHLQPHVFRNSGNKIYIFNNDVIFLLRQQLDTAPMINIPETVLQQKKMKTY